MHLRVATVVALAEAEAVFLQQPDGFRVGLVDRCQDGPDAAFIGKADQRLDDFIAESTSQFAAVSP
nr:hypothetical protein [Mesorhizobium amorphae]